MPLQRRLPKRGFSRARFRIEVQNVNLADLARFQDVREFDRERMAALGLIDPNGGPVKVLARGKLDRAVNVRADGFSEAARVAIEAAGGTAEMPEGNA
jgi:large subunit ribosomal protein L15